jgi:peptidoglycan hydrolase-like protein with peptidoglycan-binding domain
LESFMRYQKVLLAGIVLAAILPLSVSAMSIDELQSQIATLLAQITQLQVQVMQLNASSTLPSASSTAAVTNVLAVSSLPACPTLTRSLSRGASGNDVRSLQSFLLAGQYLSADAVTGYFGALTQSAVQRWQTANNIVSSGAAASTGWGSVGAQTRTAMLSSCDTSIPQNDTLSVGAQGLSVTARATVNTRSSCGAGSYTLDFGDGTPVQTISVPAQTCRSVQEALTHAYASAGPYTIVLSSGTYHINAPVTLTAPAVVCNAPVFATVTNGLVATSGIPWSLPLVVAVGSSSDISVSAEGGPSSLIIGQQIGVNASTSAVTDIWTYAGTPTTTGTYSVQFTAVNSCGTSTRTITLPIQ